MSDELERLLALGDLDTTITQLQHRRARLGPEGVEGLTAVEAQLKALAAEAVEATGRRTDLEAAQKVLEAQIATLNERREGIEQRMYSATGSSTRDLQAMSEEVRHLNQRRAGLEEQELVAMVEQEPIDAELDALAARQGPVAAEAERLRAAVAEQGGDIETELATAIAARATAAAALPAALAERYETLSRRLKAVGVARLIGHHCDGCHLEELSSWPRWSASGTNRSTPSPPATSAGASSSRPDGGGLLLILVRHGESEGNARGLLLGRIDAPLTELGRAQAASVCRLLHDPVLELRTSSLRRARDTAAALGAGVGAEVDERWIEVDYGAFDGQPPARASRPTCGRGGRRDPDYRPEGGETLRQVDGRVAAACAELFADDGGGGGRRSDGDVVVVSHVTPIKSGRGLRPSGPTPGCRGGSTSTPRRSPASAGPTAARCCTGSTRWRPCPEGDTIAGCPPPTRPSPASAPSPDRRRLPVHRRTIDMAVYEHPAGTTPSSVPCAISAPGPAARGARGSCISWSWGSWSAARTWSSSMRWPPWTRSPTPSAPTSSRPSAT